MMLLACSINRDSSPNEIVPSPSDETDLPSIDELPIIETQSKAEKLLKNMTLKEKIGQLFIIRPDALQLNLTSEQINEPTKYGLVEFDIKM